MQTVTKTGLIIKAISGFYYCQTKDGVYECRGRGVFRNENITPLVGDMALFETDEECVIEGTANRDESVLPAAQEGAGRKKSERNHSGREDFERSDSREAAFPPSGAEKSLSREGMLPGGFVTEILGRRNEFTRPPIANLDKLFIVVAVTQPVPSTLVIDKLTTICEYKDIEPVLVITKTDLGDEEELALLYRKAGFRVFCVSNTLTEDFSEIRECLRDCISAFAGNTGVGKSSLLNNICPSLELATSQISHKLGRGRHTTRHVELFRLPDLSAYVADTPGFGTMDMARYESIKKDQLQYCFREFAPYLEDCHFTGCSHRSEKGCAVLEALHDGKINASRHESYVALYNDASRIKDWEVGKRG